MMTCPSDLTDQTDWINFVRGMFYVRKDRLIKLKLTNIGDSHHGFNTNYHN
jgi:hypothetical protein